ncbi:hypothetical protein GCM10011321_04050 [Youhaiella tibetensis]|nr:hypothetical protein GCM10011321_04050 [Youhaiella tibetensis]
MRTGTQAFGDANPELDDSAGLGQRKGLRIRVGHYEINSVQAGINHIVNGVTAGAAATEHSDAGLKFLNIRDCEVDWHAWPHSGV